MIKTDDGVQTGQVSAGGAGISVTDDSGTAMRMRVSRREENSGMLELA